MSEITPLEKFKYCRDQIQYEYGVLGNRLTSYITSQSFLFSSYGISMSNPNPTWGVTFRLCFPLIVSIVGILTSIRAHPGIQSACDILNVLHKRQYELYREPTVQELDPTDPEWSEHIHRHSLKFSAVSTLIFGGAWLALLPLALYVYFSSTHQTGPLTPLIVQPR